MLDRHTASTPFCCCLFAYLFHRASCVPSRQRVQVPPSAPRALRERPRFIRTSLTSCGRKKQLWFRSFQLLLEYRQANLLSRGGAVWAAAPPAYGALARQDDRKGLFIYPPVVQRSERATYNRLTVVRVHPGGPNSRRCNLCSPVSIVARGLATKEECWLIKAGCITRISQGTPIPLMCGFNPRYSDDLLDITNKELRELRASHSGICDVCGKTETSNTHPNTKSDSNNLCVDHDHNTKEFRGFLCVQCNRNFGWYDKYKPKIYEHEEFKHRRIGKRIS